jgi:hypothetical protein
MTRISAALTSAEPGHHALGPVLLEIKASKRHARLYLAGGLALLTTAVVLALIPHRTRDDTLLHVIMSFFTGGMALLALIGAQLTFRMLKYRYVFYTAGARRIDSADREYVMKYVDVTAVRYHAHNQSMQWMVSSAETLALTDQKGTIFQVSYGRGRFLLDAETTPLRRVCMIASQVVLPKLRQELEARGALRWTQLLTIAPPGLVVNGRPPTPWADVTLRTRPGKLQLRSASRDRSIAHVENSANNFQPLLQLVIELGARPPEQVAGSGTATS